MEAIAEPPPPTTTSQTPPESAENDALPSSSLGMHRSHWSAPRGPKPAAASYVPSGDAKEAKVEADVNVAPADDDDEDHDEDHQDEDSVFAVPDEEEEKEDQSSVADADEEKYGDFVSYVDFIDLVKFMEVLKGKMPFLPKQRVTPEKELETLMKETEGEKDDGSSLARFLDFLMGKKEVDDEEGGKGIDRKQFNEFLGVLDSQAKMEGVDLDKGKDEIWNDMLRGMAPKEERVSPEAQTKAYWSYIVNPSRAATTGGGGEQQRRRSSLSMWGTVRTWFGYDGASAAERESGAEVGKVYQVERQQPPGEEERDANTIASSPSCENDLV